MLVPGLMEVFRNPTHAESWGKATVDIALIGLTAAKFEQASKFTNAGFSCAGNVDFAYAYFENQTTR